MKASKCPATQAVIGEDDGLRRHSGGPERTLYRAWEKTPFFAFTYEPKASMSSLQEVTHAETVVLLWYGGLKTSFLD